MPSEPDDEADGEGSPSAIHVLDDESGYRRGEYLGNDQGEKQSGRHDGSGAQDVLKVQRGEEDWTVSRHSGISVRLTPAIEDHSDEKRLYDQQARISIPQAEVSSDRWGVLHPAGEQGQCRDLAFDKDERQQGEGAHHKKHNDDGALPSES